MVLSHGLSAKSFSQSVSGATDANLLVTIRSPSESFSKAFPLASNIALADMVSKELFSNS